MNQLPEDMIGGPGPSADSPDAPLTISSSTVSPTPRGRPSGPPGKVVALEIQSGAPGSIPRSLVPATESPWANWEAKEKFAQRLIASGFLPQAIRTPAQVLAIIQTGQELGIPPMQALRQINVIQGKPTLSAELMLAKMIKGGVKLAWLKSSDTEAELKASRPGTSFTGRFTMEEARLAGLLIKDGWKRYPKAMLRARVVSLVARVVAPDLIAGMYTPEELGADVNDSGEIVSVVTGAATEATPAPFFTGDAADLPWTSAQWIEAFQQAPDAAAVAALRTRAKAAPMSLEGSIQVTAAWLDAKQRTANPPVVGEGGPASPPDLVD